jgi:DNA-binding MarR family transcriptional regulator
MNQDIKESRQNSGVTLSQRFALAVRSSQVANDIFDETLADFLGINRTDGRCLDIIDRAGRVSAGQLSAQSGLTTGAVTAVIDRLEAAGYAHRIRDGHDRRKIWIETTEEMRAITRHIFGHYAESAPRLMQRFTPEQIRGILEFLEISAHVNLSHASTLRQHLDPTATSAAARLSHALAFEKAVAAGQADMDAELAKISYEAD